MSTPRSFVDIVKTSRTDLIFLIRGKDRGFDAWYYFRVDKNKRDLFEKEFERSTINLKDYGEILFSGWGHTPPEHTVNAIESGTF